MTTPQTTPELPTLPQSLINTIGEYGMARTDRVTPIELTHRWELLIAGIKEYAASVRDGGVTAAPLEGVSASDWPKLAELAISGAAKTKNRIQSIFDKARRGLNASVDIALACQEIDALALIHAAQPPKGAPASPQPLAPPPGLMALLIELSDAGYCDVDGDFQHTLPLAVREAVKAEMEHAQPPASALPLAVGVEPALQMFSKLGAAIATQDNRATDAPIFIVQQKRSYVTEEGYNDSRYEWRETESGDYSGPDDEELARLDKFYSNEGHEPKGWKRFAIMDVWEFVTACFTEQGCKDYLDINGHNLKEPRIYAEGSFRNEEFRSIRKALIDLAASPPPPGRVVPLTEPEEWDFWDVAGLSCAGYNSAIDADLISVFIESATEGRWYADIAKRLGLQEHYVELLKEILSSADFCEYGTSPRGAWAIEATYADNLAKLKAWYLDNWNQEFTPHGIKEGS